MHICLDLCEKAGLRPSPNPSVPAFAADVAAASALPRTPVVPPTSCPPGPSLRPAPPTPRATGKKNDLPSLTEYRPPDKRDDREDVAVAGKSLAEIVRHGRFDGRTRWRRRALCHERKSQRRLPPPAGVGFACERSARCALRKARCVRPRLAGFADELSPPPKDR